MGKNFSGCKHNQEQRDDYANQNNTNNDANKAARDNRSNQLNPNNEKYYKSRNYSKKGR